MGMNTLIDTVIIGAINSSIYALPNGNALKSFNLSPQLLKCQLPRPKDLSLKGESLDSLVDQT